MRTVSFRELCVTSSTRGRPPVKRSSKSRASAFFGTVLTTIMIREKVDSLIIIGCATSGCVRASVIDGHSLGWPVIVAHNACFNRAPLSHDVNLFEMNAKYAHVVSTAEILAAFG